jgi:hypothetical protein
LASTLLSEKFKVFRKGSEQFIKPLPGGLKMVLNA